MRHAIDATALANHLSAHSNAGIMAAYGVDTSAADLVSLLGVALSRLETAHQEHFLDDNPSGFLRQCRAAPDDVHLVHVRDPLPVETWHTLARSRSVLERSTVAFALSQTAQTELSREAPDLASVLLSETYFVARRYRVLAWPMRDAERSAVLEAMRRVGELAAAEEGMIAGELDADEIRSLVEEGIDVQTFDRDVDEERAMPALPLAWPARFEVDMDLYAVTSLQRSDLAGVTILERIAPERFLTEVRDEASLSGLLRSQGVSLVRAATVARRSPGGLESLSPRALWVVLLHREDDSVAVAARSHTRGAEVLVALGRALRVEADAAFADEAESWPEVRRVEPYVLPELSANVFRSQIGLPPEPSDTNLSWDGTGELIALADSGVDAGHPELEGAVASSKSFAQAGDSNDTSDSQGHGTHVAGILVGRGRHHPELRGVAPGAKLHVQRIVDDRGQLSWLPDDLEVLLRDAYDRGARIHNDSWGALIEGRYDLRAEQMDDFVYRHRDMLIVVAAGNRGAACKPADRESSAPTGFVEYGSIEAPALAKNVVTVGACRSVRTSGGRAQQTWNTHWRESFPDDPIASQCISGDGESMAATSSRGPAEESRIKPDIVAPGTDIASTWPRGLDGACSWGLVPNTDKLYRYLGGTSMAAPIVAGCAALVRQYYRVTRSHRPSAALLKATLLNGARPLTGEDAVHGADAPNFHQGFGRVDLSTTLPGAFELAFDDGWEDRSRWLSKRGAYARLAFECVRAGEVRVCLVWTDPPARGNQNELRLAIDLPDGSRRVGNAIRAGRRSERPDDQVNNVLSLRLADAQPGRYLVSVQTRTLLRSQDFALVVTGSLAADTLKRIL